MNTVSRWLSGGENGMTRGARHAVIFLFLLSLALAVNNLLFTAHEVNRLRTAVLAQCKFDSDIGGAPIAVSPATHKASLLGVEIVSDARQSWHGLNCPGTISKPAPSFVKWARHYQLPAN